jgi:hypothetical protein
MYRGLRVKYPLILLDFSDTWISVIKGFRHEVAENCILLGYYAGVTVTIKNYDYSLGNNPEECSS